MKQYLWAGIAVLVVSASASDNPFDLKENFGKIDQDQETLLSDLRKMAEAKELLDEEDVNNIPSKVIPSHAEDVIPAPTPKKELVSETISVEEELPVENVSEARLNEMREKAMEAAREAKVATEKKNIAVEEVVVKEKTKEPSIEDIHAKEAEIAQLKAAQEEQLRIQHEAEAREVAAYEKKRAEKLAKKREEEKRLALEEKQKQEEAAKKEALAKKEEARLKVAREAAAKKLKKSSPKKVITKATSSVVDINISQEAIDAKRAADLEYEAAVKEMSEEDE